MARATWNGAVIAESDVFEVVEGNVYFPADAVRREYLAESATHTVCPWKGTASYYSGWWTGRRTATRRGTIPIPGRRRATSRGTWRSGAGSGSSDDVD